MLFFQKRMILGAFILSTIASVGGFAGELYAGDTKSPMAIDDFAAAIKPSDVLVIGELHGMGPIQAGQMDILNALKRKGLKISVGFEFLNYTDQSIVNNFTSGLISEETFKQSIGWGKGFDFSFYKNQILFSGSAGGQTQALNMPSRITRKISQGGLVSLTAEDQLLLPPQFTLGRDTYKSRFFKSMGHPVPADKELNYFTAQSLWDDTMAWQTVNYVQNHKDVVFVIIVGEFHVQYGGGLPDRIMQRLQAAGLNNSVKTVSQIWADGLTEQDIQNEMQADPVDGIRADYIWVGKP